MTGKENSRSMTGEEKAESDKKRTQAWRRGKGAEGQEEDAGMTEAGGMMMAEEIIKDKQEQ